MDEANLASTEISSCFISNLRNAIKQFSYILALEAAISNVQEIKCACYITLFSSLQYSQISVKFEK